METIYITELSGNTWQLDLKRDATVGELHDQFYARRRTERLSGGFKLVSPSRGVLNDPNKKISSLMNGEGAGATIGVISLGRPSYVLTASRDHTAKLWETDRGKCIMTFYGHIRSVESAVFSSDGACVLTASNDHTAKLWDCQRGTCIKTFNHKA